MNMDRRGAIRTIAGAGAVSLAGCSAIEKSESDITSDIDGAAALPFLFDCNAWVGVTDVEPISSRLYRPPDGGFDRPAALLGEMDRVGIDRALVYHVTARTENAKAGNERVMEVTADHPRFEPCWVWTPEATDDYGSATGFVEAMETAEVRAVRMFPGEHDYRLVDDVVEPMLAALTEADKILVLDALSGVVQEGFTHYELGELATRRASPGEGRPGLAVILTQLYPSMGTFLDDDLSDVLSLATNIYVGTARYQVHDGLRKFVDQFGVDRLIFGTHMPHAAAGAGVGTLMLSSLTADEKRKVAGENLEEVLGTGNDSIGGAIGRMLSGKPTSAPDRELKTVPYGIVDLHGHIYAYKEIFGEQWPDADGLVAQMDRTGIDLSCVSCLSEGPDGIDVGADAARRYPDRFVPVAYVDPTWDDPSAVLERAFDELGMRMIKIHPASDGVMPDDPAYDVVWEFTEERECLVVTHAKCTEEETTAFIEVAEAYSNMTLMLYHATRSWVRVDNYVSVVEQCPNVLLEITYSYNVDGIIEYLVEQVGAERVFFGTDLGTRAPESQVGWATYARLSEAEQKLFMRDNGLRLLADLGVLPDAYRDDL